MVKKKPSLQISSTTTFLGNINGVKKTKNKIEKNKIKNQKNLNIPNSVGKVDPICIKKKNFTKEKNIKKDSKTFKKIKSMFVI